MTYANSDLNFVTPPREQGRIISLSYAVDAERELVICRSFDASDQTETYAVTPLENLVGDFEPWNRTPRFADPGLWHSAS